MARPCSICQHTNREEIDHLIIDGVPYREIAARYGTSQTTVGRHKEAHLGARVAEVRAKEYSHIVSLAERQQQKEMAVADRLDAHADTILAKIIELYDKAKELLSAAESAGDLKTAISGVKEARGCLETLAKLEGQLNEGTTINILVQPQFVQVRDCVFGALDKFPEAKAAVVAALDGVIEGEAR